MIVGKCRSLLPKLNFVLSVTALFGPLMLPSHYAVCHWGHITEFAYVILFAFVYNASITYTTGKG